jgi:hypothetical protein
MNTFQTLIARKLIARTTFTVACLWGLAPLGAHAQIDDLGCHRFLTAKECHMLTERYMELDDAERPAFRATYAAMLRERERMCQCTGGGEQLSAQSEAKPGKAVYTTAGTTRTQRR